MHATPHAPPPAPLPPDPDGEGLGRLLVSLDGRILEVNPRLARWLRQPRLALVGADVGQFLGEVERVLVLNTLEELRLGRQDAVRLNLELRLADGLTLPARASLTLAPGAGEEPAPTLVLLQNRSKELELREELEALRWRDISILDSAGEGIYGLDRQGRVTFINPAALRMLGLRSEEVLGQGFHELAHHSHADGRPYPREDCPTTAALREGWVQRVDHDVYWRRDGSSFPVEYVSTPILSGGRVAGAVVIFSDISARVAAEQTRTRMELQLRQASKLEAVGQLAAGIAHEINTPAQYVGANLQFLTDAYADIARLAETRDRLVAAAAEFPELAPLVEEARALAEAIDLEFLRQEIPAALAQTQEGVQRIAHIVGAMKEFSHPGAQEKTPTDLNRGILTTLEVSRNEWKYTCEVETDLDPALPLVSCLPGELNQALLNLIVNAAQAMPAGADGARGRIHLRTRRVDGDWVEIQVRDTGTGIPEAIRERVFEPFFTTKEVGKGSGQGLAQVYATVVERHGGTIDLDSQDGVGTCFTLKMPIGEPAAKAVKDG